MTTICTRNKCGTPSTVLRSEITTIYISKQTFTFWLTYLRTLDGPPWPHTDSTRRGTTLSPATHGTAS